MLPAGTEPLMGQDGQALPCGQLMAGGGAAAGDPAPAGNALATRKGHQQHQSQQQQQHHARFARFGRPSTEPCRLPNSCLARLPAGQGGATAVAFSPGGLYLAAACAGACNRFSIVVGALAARSTACQN
jgi:hypothetical protein